MLSSERFSPDTHSAEEVVKALRLQVLDQEGGYFRRTAESGLWVKPIAPNEESIDSTRAYSLIYVLFTPDGFSALHRLRHDEIWCWHAGDPIESLRLYADGRGEWVGISERVEDGGTLHNIVPADVWQGTRLKAGGRWALVSCIMAPEFLWRDFELAQPAELTSAYPAFAAEIEALIRPEPMSGVK